MIDVSVIITTKNEGKNIGNCLDSVYKQDYSLDRIEVILVDNNSTDNTKSIASRYNCRIFTYGPERSAQRNFAAKKAYGEYILLLDADMTLTPDLISKCVHKCRQDGLIALYIPEKIIGAGIWIKFRDFERSFYNATVIDCVRFVLKNKFLEIGGFDEKLTGPEDWDFDRRIKDMGKVGIIDSPIYHNEGKFDIVKYIRKKRYYGKSFKRYIDKWGSDDGIVKRQLGLTYRFFGVFIEKGKWRKLVMHPLLAFGIYILRFLVGLSYISNKIKYCLK